jgi:hypothetical protein
MIYSVKELTEGKIKGRLEKQIKCYTPTMFSKSIKIMKKKNLIMIIIKKNVVFQLKKKKKNV